MAAPSAAHSVKLSSDKLKHAANPAAARLRKHADYQRAYKASRKQFSSSMTYFCAPQPETLQSGPRVGITAGRVLGNAVERNRIKRRLREAIRANQALLPAGLDVILHPRRSVLVMDYVELRLEIGRIFSKVAAGNKASGIKATGVRSSGEKSSAGSGSR